MPERRRRVAICKNGRDLHDRWLLQKAHPDPANQSRLGNLEEACHVAGTPCPLLRIYIHTYSTSIVINLMQPDSAPRTQRTLGFSPLLRITVRLVLSVADDRDPPGAAARSSSSWHSTGPNPIGGRVSALSRKIRPSTSAVRNPRSMRLYRETNIPTRTADQNKSVRSFRDIGRI